MPSWNETSRQSSGGLFRRTLFVAGAATVLGILGASLVWSFARERENAALDPETFCPKAGPVAVTDVLIDRTDGLNAIQGVALQERLMLWAHQVPKHGAFRVYEVGYGGMLLEPVVTVCNPGDGSDQSAIDSNPKMWRARYEEKFEAPVRQMVDAMQLDTEAPSSPILEAIQAIAVRDFGPGSPAELKQLIIVSDLLQHSDGLSLYRGVPDFASFWQGAYARSLAVDLSGVRVGVHLLNRRDAATRQSDALGEFWIRWLKEQGGVVEEFRIIPG